MEAIHTALYFSDHVFVVSTHDPATRMYKLVDVVHRRELLVVHSTATLYSNCSPITLAVLPHTIDATPHHSIFILSGDGALQRIEQYSKVVHEYKLQVASTSAADFKIHAYTTNIVVWNCAEMWILTPQLQLLRHLRHTYIVRCVAS
uniref:Uncharacterized protein n=1 Tax=Lygus hesperus TaxID=30085 RepID=A0A0A9XW58_LYGHE